MSRSGSGNGIWFFDDNMFCIKVFDVINGWTRRRSAEESMFVKGMFVFLKREDPFFNGIRG